MQNALLRQPFDGRDVVAVMHHGKRQAAVDSLPVDDDGTGAALPLIAALLRTGEPQMLAQGIEQCRPRVEIEGIRTPVDREIDVLGR